MGAQAPVEAALLEFIGRVCRRFALSRAILFGSRARGDALASSDYDVILVSQDFEGTAWPKRMTQVLAYWEGPPGLEALCYAPAEFARKAREISIVSEALEEGTEIPLPR